MQQMFFFNQENQTFTSKSIENAYFSILKGDLHTAKSIFENIDSPRSHWGKCFVDILIGYVENFPTYFEIRNFLEIDLDFLIKNNKINYVEQILGSLEHLSDINQEVYKYVARVFYENRLYKASLEYLEKSKKIFYKDPELHFMLAKYYLNSRDYEDSYFYIKECLKILPDYYPAKNLKMKIEKYLKID